MKRIAIKELANTEEEDAEFWFESHKCDHPKPELFITEHYTEIGTVVFANCTCGKSENVTDYDKW